MTSRNHPVRQLLDEAARGQKPSREALAALDDLAGDGVPAAWIRSEVQKAAAAIVEVRAGGYMGEARREAAAATEEIVSHLPDHEEPVERELPDDPRELAKLARGETVPEGEDDPRKLAAKIDRGHFS